MSNGRSAAWMLLLLLPMGFTGIWKLQRNINVQRDAMHQEQDEVLVRSPKLLKLATLEYATLAADIYWTRAVQYYGGKRLGEDSNLESLWPLLDAATTLDPNLLPAYRFGATFLGEPAPRGAGRPDLAIELLQRGMKENPDYWRLDQDLGNIYYLELKDYSNAGQAYLNGSTKPGAAAWMKIMAARLLEKAIRERPRQCCGRKSWSPAPTIASRKTLGSIWNCYAATRTSTKSTKFQRSLPEKLAVHRKAFAS